MRTDIMTEVEKQTIRCYYSCSNTKQTQEYQTSYLTILKETMLELLAKVNNNLLRFDIYVRPISQQDTHQDRTEEKNSCIAMKEKGFFQRTIVLTEQVLKTIRFNIQSNTKLTDDERTFVLTVLAYAAQHGESIVYSLTPRDFLLYLVTLLESLDVLTVLTYALYDTIWTTLSFLRLKQQSIRQVIVPKERTWTKPKRRLYVTLTKRDAMFVSSVITEVVLQLIEKGVIRCSSIAKCFLVTNDEATFYKYCLIRGRSVSKPSETQQRSGSEISECPTPFALNLHRTPIQSSMSV